MVATLDCRLHFTIKEENAMCLGALDLRNVRKIRSILDECIGSLVKNHRDILCKNPASDFTRSCFFTPERMLSILLRFGAKNAESELIDLLDCGNTSRNINASFLMQRRKLGEQCLPFLFNSFTDAIMHDPSLKLSRCLVKGRHLLACDGSDVNIAYNPSDPLTYIKKKGKRGYNQVHLNALFDVCTGLYMSASVQGIHKKQERRALVEMIATLKDARNSIVTADRGYEGFNVFAAMVESGAEYVIRMKDIDSNGILSAYELEDGEFDVDISTRLTKRRTKETMGDIQTYTILPYCSEFDFFDEDMMYDIEFRVVRFRLPNGSYVCVATNLSREEFDMDDLREIYRRRWACEIAFRRLKYTVGLVNFHSRKMQYIRQELYARLTMYNFTAATVKTLEPPKASEGKYVSGQESSENADVKEMCIAFSQAVTVCRKLLEAHTLSYIKKAIEIIKGHTFAKKPGRAYARKVKPQSYRPFCYKTS